MIHRNSNWQRNQGPSGCRASSGSAGRAAKCFLVVKSLQQRSVFLDHRCSSWPPAVSFCSFAVREQGKNFDDFYLIGKVFFFFSHFLSLLQVQEGYTNWLCELWEEAAEEIDPRSVLFLGVQAPSYFVEFIHHGVCLSPLCFRVCPSLKSVKSKFKF